MRKRDLFILLGALGAALGFGLHLMAFSVLSAGAWGLSFRSEGAAPLGPVSASQLAKYDGVFLGDTAEKVIYLTFDAGFENGCTSKILDVLKAHKVPAAFFLVGNYITQNADLVRRMANEGHTVGNHTMHHYDMSKISDRAVFEKELTDFEALYEEAVGSPLKKYYRPPQGCYSEANLKMAKDLGYKTVFWSLAYVDWDQKKQPSADYAFSKLLPRTHNGAVVLLHSTSSTNAAILDELLTKWEEMGYRFASIDALFPENAAG